jgi:ABC-type nitrate/sulfonate/bicarbonate transport system substrate-binding protein
VTGGTGTIVLDVRRGGGPAGCFDYTMPVLATTDRLIENSPETAAAALRALVATQQALKADPSRATEVGHKRFPPRETRLIAGIIRRDLPYYDAAIGESSVAAINAFARRIGVLDGDVAYGDVVATQFRHLWRTEAAILRSLCSRRLEGRVALIQGPWRQTCKRSGRHCEAGCHPPWP